MTAKMTEQKTRLDQRLERLKNHWLVVWILIVGVVIIALGNFTNALRDIKTFFSPSNTVTVLETTKQPTGGRGNIELPPEPKAPSARAAKPQVSPTCRYVLFPPFDTVAHYAYFTIGDEKLALDEHDLQSAWILALKSFDSGEYDFTAVFRVDQRPTTTIAGFMALTERQFYRFNPTTASQVRNRQLAEPVAENDVKRFLARYRIQLPRCEDLRPGADFSHGTAPGD
jgi:hypothetical protein